MKYRDPVTGNLLDIFLPAGGDTLPIGTIVNYDGEDVPMNYELVDGGEILNEASTSMNDSYSCNYVNNLNVYSTEEKVIGKWIDGKPIYRKVIEFNALSTGSNTFPLNISNLGKIILFNCNAYRSNSDFPIPYLDKSTDGSTTPVTAYLSTRINNKTTLEIKDGWGSGITGGYLILEYTKTTD